MRVRRRATPGQRPYRAAKRELLEVADVVMVEDLLHGYEYESGDGEHDLQVFHAEPARARRLLAPLG